MGFTFKDYSDVVLKQVDANAMAAMERLKGTLVEKTQEKMLYGYSSPVLDTGRLCDSIQGQAARASQNTYEVQVGTNVPYAIFVSEGTYKMAGRPFIRDAIMENQGEIQSVMAGTLGAGL